MGPWLRRPRRLTAAFALVPVLVLSGCRQESSTIAADHTTASGAVTSSTAAANTDEYVVSLTADDGDGSVIFSPDLRVLETSVYR